MLVLGYDEVSAICLVSGCRLMYCNSCAQNNRCNHRHPLYNLTFKRPAVGASFHNIMSSCSYCHSRKLLPNFTSAPYNSTFPPLTPEHYYHQYIYFFTHSLTNLTHPLSVSPGFLFVGIECADCHKHRICAACLMKSMASYAVFPPGMPHAMCPGRGNNWWGYVMVPPGWPVAQQFQLHQQFTQQR